jgi:hypothetical protein
VIAGADLLMEIAHANGHSKAEQACLLLCGMQITLHAALTTNNLPEFGRRYTQAQL